MLYIILRDRTGPEIELGWHVQDKINRDHMSKAAHLISEIQADGDELELILAKSTNIPYNSERVQSWFGDHAKWIVRNVIMKVKNIGAIEGGLGTGLDKIVG